MKKILALLIIMTACSTKKNSQGENFLSKVDQTNIQDDSELLTFFDNPRQPLGEAFTVLPVGSTRPKGWILELMEQDLEEGIVGALDELYPGIASDDLYGKHRRGGLDDVPEMGDLVLTGEEWETSIMWWNAETAGNWWDGFVRHAFLTNNEKAMAQSRKIVANLLKSQDANGYIGIYKPSLRYQHEGSNGELWAQTTAFRTLLGYYELTQEQQVLEAVERAMAVTMKEYNQETRNPFELKNAFGGVTHGLMLTDVCETLYRITGNQAYQDYAVYLYRAFSTFSINRAFNDFRYPFLTQRDSMFTGHGVHTYEHIRSMLNAYYQTGYPEMKEAYENSLHKLAPVVLPSGAGHGNEWILAMDADPTHTATEYCTMLELRNSLASLVQKTGDFAYADHAEKLTFNGMMGSRNKNGTAITYGKHDNAYVLDGKHHHDDHSTTDPRYKYSPTHSDPAVCCVPNYTRNNTYYLDNMWMKKGEDLVAVLYGPSTLETEVNGVKVTIEQETNYPFSDDIQFKVQAAAPVEFKLYLRKPQWSGDINIAGVESAKEGDDLIVIAKEWGSDDFTLTFHNEVTKMAFNDEYYFQRGPLVYALPIAHKEKVIKQYGLPRFKDYYALPTDDRFKSLTLTDSPFEFKSSDKKNFPWYGMDTYLQGSMLNTKTGKEETVKLIPLGSTVLRRVTFEEGSE